MQRCDANLIFILVETKAISDVRYGKFCILPITIIALFFYRDTINYHDIQIA